LEHAKGVRDLSPGWSEAEPWVLDSRMCSALKERQMFARLCTSAWPGESCSKTRKHRGSEHFTHDAQIL